MCVGFPMRVIKGDDLTATCDRRGEARTVSMLLVGARYLDTAAIGGFARVEFDILLRNTFTAD